MLQALFTLIPPLLVGGLAALSHWAKKNIGAEITLFVLLVFSSLLVVAVGGLLLVAGLVGGVPESLVSTTLFLTVAGAVALAGLVGLGLCLPPLWSIVGRMERGFWSEPPVFFALWMFVMVLVLSTVGLVTFVGADQGQLAAGLGGRLSPLDVAVGQLPLVIVAVFGVGLWVRRSPRQVVARLGYGALTAKQLGVCALFVLGALLLSVASDRVFAALQPRLYERVGELSSQLFSTQGMGLVSVLLFGLLLGVGAALGEESLFRGAVQPVLGILPTSLLFAALHVQYGPSVSIVYIVVLAVGLGLLRKKINTSAAFVAHAAYNFLSVVLGHFLGGGF
ncbi:CPBP family intramembrane glutamic endopeptidase [Rubrobacter aplysinae]|uniref:CPBP family intramembrane glutamic endopeptidase n=1 Tax=Rubrobacter aplysinae TaxID=909625 RepID=UPI00064B8E93|nr:CPBP family intramembrane glutamic endopeptidase [Rubrobacter aplysinae]